MSVVLVNEIEFNKSVPEELQLHRKGVEVDGVFTGFEQDVFDRFFTIDGHQLRCVFDSEENSEALISKAIKFIVRSEDVKYPELPEEFDYEFNDDGAIPIRTSDSTELKWSGSFEVA